VEPSRVRDGIRRRVVLRLSGCKAIDRLAMAWVTCGWMDVMGSLRRDSA
jgi:hypothetical protein